MPTPNERTVTAQDFINEMVEVQEPDVCPETYDWKETRENWEELLFRARQEARREALKEMDEAWCYKELNGGYEELSKLRQEYSNQP